MLDEIGSPATVATTGNRYFGFVIGGTLPAAMAASWLANAWDQNVALRVMSPVAAELEEVVLRWVCDALGLPSGCEGGLVTCATMANFTALAAARYSLLAKSGWNVVDDGNVWRSAHRSRRGRGSSLLGSESAESCGFRKKRVTIVEADGQGQNARRQVSETQRPHHRLPPSRKREHRSLRSSRARFVRARRNKAHGFT